MPQENTTGHFLYCFDFFIARGKMKFDISGFFGHVKPLTKVIKIFFNSSTCVPCSLCWSTPMRRQKGKRMMKMTKMKRKKRTSSFLFVVSPLALPENYKNQDSSLFVFYV